ncbi:MAG TPA: LecA/PA-IL family lectin [Pyrinomonadaceae bacterium]|nr:LecA/PA-IL family lectin [Pyrinomonadaceae bacterium]
MFTRSKFVRVLATFVLLAVASTAAFADTIKLKDGSIFKGKITSFMAGKFTITIGEGARAKQLTFFANEVESISFDQRNQADNVATTPKPAVYQPVNNPPKVVIADNPTPTVVTPKTNTVSNAKPIEWSVKVLADNTSNGWTNTGWVVKKGQRIRISGDGTVSLGGNRSTTPSGEDFEDANKLLKNVPTGALIAVIGDDNNEFIYIGAEREIVATRDGSLFLGINEGNLDDNRGSFNVKVAISPEY